MDDLWLATSTELPVLISGSGNVARGIAHTIHRQTRTAERAFVCLPLRPGTAVCWEATWMRAEGGILFIEGAEHLTGLDQAWLFERLRSTQEQRATVRLIMSASTSLYALCVDGRFSESLLYHVNAIHLVPDPVSPTTPVASPNGQPDRREH